MSRVRFWGGSVLGGNYSPKWVSFGWTSTLDQLDAKSIGVITHRLPSFGTFSTNLEPSYLYGSIPQSVKLSGVAMDVDRIFTLAASNDDDQSKSVTFFRATGPRKSAFEHLVPEQLFSTAENPAQGISAVKALAIAAQQGQKIYMLTSANAAQLNSLTISTAAKQDIRNAINAGKEVTVHESPITYAGWTGEGYAVIDPETGAGAWKISGGKNGAGLYLAVLGLWIIATLSAGFVVGALLGILVVQGAAAALSALLTVIAAAFWLKLVLDLAAVKVLCANLLGAFAMFFMCVQSVVTSAVTSGWWGVLVSIISDRLQPPVQESCI